MTTLETPRPEIILEGAKQRLKAGDAVGARAILESAAAASPDNISILMELALACRLMADWPAALRALNAALAIDPYEFLALLTKGVVIEKMGDMRAAAAAYATALRLAPDPPAPFLVKPIEHARAIVAEDRQRKADFLHARLAAHKRAHGGADFARIDECVDIFVGKAKPHFPDPALLLFPRLPPVPFFDDAFFPWMRALESKTSIIRAELEAVLADQQGLRPYVQKEPGAPVNQWSELNYNPNWSVYFFWENSIKFEDNCARCPQTTAILESLPLARQPDYGPTAMFSILKPHTHIPPHTGSANTRVICHLPLILPEKCSYRVGNDRREWKMGKAWVFDDSIEHEARNDSDFIRVMLIFDVWNPYLTEAERDLVSELLLANRAYLAGQ